MGYYIGVEQCDRLEWLRIFARIYGTRPNGYVRDVHYDVHATYDLSEDCVVAVEGAIKIVLIVCNVYEELACGRVCLTSVRHGYSAIEVNVFGHITDFVWDCRDICACDVASLNHEVCDYTVENCTVV